MDYFYAILSFFDALKMELQLHGKAVKCCKWILLCFCVINISIFLYSHHYFKKMGRKIKEETKKNDVMVNDDRIKKKG